MPGARPWVDGVVWGGMEPAPGDSDDLVQEEPGDDSHLAVYLFCVPESDFVSGEVVVASGGLRM